MLSLESQSRITPPPPPKKILDVEEETDTYVIGQAAPTPEGGVRCGDQVPWGQGGEGSLHSVGDVQTRALARLTRRHEDRHVWRAGHVPGPRLSPLCWCHAHSSAAEGGLHHHPHFTDKERSSERFSDQIRGSQITSAPVSITAPAPQGTGQ